MTRARARNIKNEVNSFLFESRLDSRENWILPQSETLFILRYEEVDREKEKMETRASMEQGRGEENEKEEEDLERAVLPPTNGTTAKTIQAVLPPNVRSTAAQPDKLLCSSDPGPVLPPSPSGTTAYKRYYRPPKRYYRSACAQPRAFGLVSLSHLPLHG